jgi:hypothetical protein
MAVKNGYLSCGVTGYSETELCGSDTQTSDGEVTRVGC